MTSDRAFHALRDLLTFIARSIRFLCQNSRRTYVTSCLTFVEGASASSMTHSGPAAWCRQKIVSKTLSIRRKAVGHKSRAMGTEAPGGLSGEVYIRSLHDCTWSEASLTCGAVVLPELLAFMLDMQICAVNRFVRNQMSYVIRKIRPKTSVKFWAGAIKGCSTHDTSSDHRRAITKTDGAPRFIPDASPSRFPSDRPAMSAARKGQGAIFSPPTPPGGTASL